MSVVVSVVVVLEVVVMGFWFCVLVVWLWCVVGVFGLVVGVCGEVGRVFVCGVCAEALEVMCGSGGFVVGVCGCLGVGVLVLVLGLGLGVSCFVRMNVVV